jgi:gentisate 1,2-dioxygenase
MHVNDEREGGSDGSCTIVRLSEARHFYDGPEECREYVSVPAFWMGTSRVPSGSTGATDSGHSQHAEMFLLVSGAGTILDGTNEYALTAGDALLIPPGTPHTLRNDGTEDAVFVWSAGRFDGQLPSDTPAG